MTVLILGLLLWISAHLFKRVLPDVRRDLDVTLGGGVFRVVIALNVLAAVVAMTLGYRMAAVIPIYSPPSWGGYANNLIMVFAIFIFGAGMARGRLQARIRHPMLTGLILWAVAHLLVNGDLASVLLFGGLLVWAVAEIYLINVQEGPWHPPAPGPGVQDAALVMVTVFVYATAAGVHWVVGYNPFLGAYG